MRSVRGALLVLLLTPVAAIAAPYAYVPAAGGVAVIDLANNSIVTTIAASGLGIAITPDGARAFITNGNVGAATVKVFNTADQSLITTLSVYGAKSVAITPDGTKAYVGTINGLQVIDTATYAVTSTAVASGNVGVVVVSPDGGRVFAVSSGNTVAVVNTSTNDVASTISIPSFATAGYALAISPAGDRLFVIGATSTAVIDTTTNDVLATLSYTGSGYGGTLNRAGTRLYIADDTSVSVFDTTDYSLVASIDVAGVPPGEGALGALALSPDGTRGYVINSSDQTLVVFDTATNAVIETISLSGGGAVFGAGFIQYSGYAVSALRDAGVPLATLDDLGIDAGSLLEGGFTASDFENAGITAEQLISGGATVSQLLNAGFSPRAILQGGASVADLAAEDISIDDLKADGATATELLAGGATLTQLKNAGFTATELRAADASLADLITTGFTDSELLDAGFTSEEIAAAHGGGGNSATAVPTLPQWAMILLAGLLARLILRAPRRSTVRVRR